MRDSGIIKAARGAAKAVFRLEFETDLGRINAIGLALTFLLIVLLGIHAVYVETLSRILPGEAPYDFPVVAVLAVFGGLFLVCAVIVALLTPLAKQRGSAPPSEGESDPS